MMQFATYTLVAVLLFAQTMIGESRFDRTGKTIKARESEREWLLYERQRKAGGNGTANEGGEGHI